MKYVVLIDVEKRPDFITDHYYVISQTEPLGLLYLESFLKPHYVPVYLCKIPLQERDWNEIRKAGMIGLSGLTYSWNTMKELAQKIRNINSRALIIAGREHASLAYDTVLKETAFDAVVVGEGEYPLLALAKGENFPNIKSLVYRNSSGEIIVNHRCSPITEQDLYPLKRRYEWMKNMLHETNHVFPEMAGIMLSRGCIFDCEFCTAKKMWGGYRNLGFLHAVNEVERIIDKFNIRYFAFHDLMLNTNPRIIRQFCEEIIERKVEANFFAMMSVTANILDFKFLRKAGFTEIGVGIEIPSDKRKEIGKVLSFKKTIEFMRAISDAGIFVRVYIIIGWPWDVSKKELIENYSSALRLLPINALRIHFLTPFPGTVTYQKYKNFCIYQPVENGFNHFTTMEPVLNFGLSPDELKEAREEIIRRYYFSKSYNYLYKKQRKTKILTEMNNAFYEMMSVKMGYG